MNTNSRGNKNIIWKQCLASSMSKELYVSVDIGGTWVKVVLADENELKIKISSKTIKKGPINALPNQVIGMIKRALKETKASKEDIKAIGSSSAGPFINRKLLAATNICGKENDWEVIPYIPALEKEFGLDVEYDLENDCVSAIHAEHLFGAARGFRNAVYLTISTGIGGGIIAENILIEGKGKNAGHFGHMIVKKRGDLCSCGLRGCIESIASARNIARRAKNAGFMWKGSQDYGAKEVFEGYRNQDKTATEIIKETIEYLAIMVINVINITDTNLIILGGSVMKNADVLLEPIKDYIVQHSIAAIAEGVVFSLPELGDFVGDLGGLSLIIPEQLKNKWVEEKPWTCDVKEIFLTQDECFQ